MSRSTKAIDVVDSVQVDDDNKFSACFQVTDTSMTHDETISALQELRDTIDRFIIEFKG